MSSALRMVRERAERLLRAYREEDYLTVVYALLMILAIHILVLLRYAPQAALTLYRFIGKGGPSVYIALVEGGLLVWTLYTFAQGFRVQASRVLGFAYGLYTVNSSLPYANLLLIVLSSIQIRHLGISISFTGLAVAVAYMFVSLVLMAVASAPKYYVLEAYKSREGGKWIPLKIDQRSVVLYDRGDAFRILYLGRRDLPTPEIVLEAPKYWSVKASTGEGRLEAVLKPKEPVDNTLILKQGGRELVRLIFKPRVVAPIRKPDTEIRFELIVPTEGGKTIRKVIVQRPGGEPLSKILEDVVPEGFTVVRVLKIEGASYVPVESLDKEIPKPKTVNKYAVELAPAEAARAAPPQPATVPGPQGPATPSPTPAPVAVASPPSSAGGLLGERAKILEDVKRLIEEYSELREDLW